MLWLGPLFLWIAVGCLCEACFLQQHKKLTISRSIWDVFGKVWGKSCGPNSSKFSLTGLGQYNLQVSTFFQHLAQYSTRRKQFSNSLGYDHAGLVTNCSKYHWRHSRMLHSTPQLAAMVHRRVCHPNRAWIAWEPQEESKNPLLPSPWEPSCVVRRELQVQGAAGRMSAMRNPTASCQREMLAAK